MTWMPSMQRTAQAASPRDQKEELRQAFAEFGIDPEKVAPQDDVDGPVPLVDPAPPRPSPPVAPPPAAPKGPAPGTIDLGELADALSQGQKGSALAGISRGADQAIAAIGHIKPDSAYWDAQQKEAGSAPVDELKQRAAISQNNATLATKAKAAAEANDPNSPRLQFAKKYYKAAGLELPDGITLAQMDKLPLKEQMEKLYDAEKAKQEIAGRAENSKAQAIIESNRIKESQGFQRSMHDVTRVEHEADNADKAAEAAKGRLVPGFQLDPNGPQPKEEEAAKFRAALANYGPMAESIHKLQDLYRKHGTEFGGKVSAEMGSLVTDLQLKVKNLAQLGVLSAGDLELVSHLVPDPTSLGSNLKGLVGADNTPTKLKELERQLNSSLENHARSLGYARSGQAAAPAAASAKPAPGAIISHDGKRYQVQADGVTVKEIQ